MFKRLILSVVIIAVLALLAYSFFDEKSQEITGNSISENTDKIVAYVNENPITQGDVKKAQEYVEAQSGKVIDQTQAVKRVIDEKLILEDAQKNGFILTKEETEKEISKILATQNQTLLDFQKKVESRGEDYEIEIENYRQQLMIEKYLDKIANQEVTEAQALAYYNENKDKMFTGEIAVPYEQISGQLKLAIKKKNGQEIISTYLEELRQKAKIEYLQ